MRQSRSGKLFSKASRYMVGGVNSPVRAFKAVGGVPVFVSEGKGSKLVDEDKNSYIDYVMSWGALILGHAYPSVVKEIQKAAAYRDWETDRKSTRLNSSHSAKSRMPSSA